MDVGQVLREARQAGGLSQRELAAASGVSARTIAAAEAGARGLTVACLTRLLGACGRELVTAPAGDASGPVAAGAPAPDALAEHLRLPLAQRLRDGLHATRPEVGGLLTRVCAVSTGRVLQLVGAAAVAVWVPGIEVPAPLVLIDRGPRYRLLGRSGAAAPVTQDDDLVVLPGTPWGPPSAVEPAMVPVPVSRSATLHVLSAARLADDPCLLVWRPALRASAELLDRRGGRDASGRRAPPHRGPDEALEAQRLSRAVRYSGVVRPVLPSPLDGRGLRIDGPASLPQWLSDRGLPPLEGQRRPRC